MSKSAACLEWMKSNLEVSQSSTIEALAQLIESDMGFTVSRLYLRKLRIDAGIVVTRTRGEASSSGQSNKASVSSQLAVVTGDILSVSTRVSNLIDKVGDISQRQEDVIDVATDIRKGYRAMVESIGEMSCIMCDMRDTINAMKAELAELKSGKPAKKASKPDHKPSNDLIAAAE